MITSARRSSALFALIALTIATAAFVVFRSAIYARNADVLAWAFTFDLTLTVPLLYYALVVRGGHARAITVAPVFVICMAIAARIVPHDQQQFLHQLRWAAAPLDVLTLWLVARRLRRGSGTGYGIVDRFLTSELTVVRFALFSWRKQAPAGFTFHKRAGWGAVLFCILMAFTGESIGMHLLLQQWSVRAAWIVTALDLYGVLWLFGDYHALRLRPTAIENGVLQLRYGLRWSADIPVGNIASLDAVTGDCKRDGVLKIAMFDEPRLLIALREPVEAIGFGGLRRREIRAIALLADEHEKFESALKAALI